MKITFKFADKDGKARSETAKLPYTGSEFVNAKTPCECGSVAIRGNGRKRVQTQHDEEEDAVCASCWKTRGRIYVWLDSFFGRDEDAVILSGRYRVY